ncbi:MAG: hypothetical protein U9P61_02915 [Patescibacteria group bacterium]|nr:hypothetical protein [Patescibacteria group bacterium]
MFEDYQFLNWFYYKKINSNGGEKNRLEKHLCWLLEKGENRQTKMICPYCKKRYIAYFSVLFSSGNDFSVDPCYTCCEDCTDELVATAVGKGKVSSLLPIKFSSLLLFWKKVDQKRIARIYRTFFQLPKKLGKKQAFNFFNG